MGVNYLICAAGVGSRFSRLGLDVPKPLLSLHGRTLLEWSVASLPLGADDTLIVISRQTDLIRAAVEATLVRRYPQTALRWLQLDQVTSGQLHTAVLSQPLWTPDRPVVVFNCDTYFRSDTLAAAMGDPALEGIVPCGQADGDMWSFCRVDEHDRAVEITEKVRISPWASVGFYFFRRPDLFLRRAEAALANPERKGEAYVAPLYQRYLAAGEPVRMDRVTVFQPMGTPEQIATFWNLSPEEFVRQNRGAGA